MSDSQEPQYDLKRESIILNDEWIVNLDDSSTIFDKPLKDWKQEDWGAYQNKMARLRRIRYLTLDQVKRGEE